jgi:hypothetical protein
MDKSNLPIDHPGRIGKSLTVTRDIDPSESLDDSASTEFQTGASPCDHSCEGMKESEIEAVPKIQLIRRQLGLRECRQQRAERSNCSSLDSDVLYLMMSRWLSDCSTRSVSMLLS